MLEETRTPDGVWPDRFEDPYLMNFGGTAHEPPSPLSSKPVADGG